MKIIIEPQNKVEELLVKILCREENEEVHRLYHHIVNYAQPLWVFKDGMQHKLYESDLYYAFTVDFIIVYFLITWYNTYRLKMDAEEINRYLEKRNANSK